MSNLYRTEYYMRRYIAALRFLGQRWILHPANAAEKKVPEPHVEGAMRALESLAVSVAKPPPPGVHWSIEPPEEPSCKRGVGQP